MLTPKQTKQVKRVINNGKVSSLKLPFLRHQFLLHWNFDDGITPLVWLADQPDTDLGTIVLLYWLMGPGYMRQHPDQDPEAFVLVKKIETNVATDFYTNQNIAVNPSNASGTNFLKETHNAGLTAEIPPALAKTTPGEPVPMESLVTKYVSEIYDLNEKDHKKLNSQIEKGFAELAAFAPEIERSSPVDNIIRALNAYTNSKRPTESGTKAKFDRKQVNTFKALDLVFGEQLVRQAGWTWQIHEVHEQVLDYRDFVLISADGKYEWHPFGGFTSGNAERKYSNENTVGEHFVDICDIDAAVQRMIRAGRSTTYGDPLPSHVFVVREAKK